MTSFIHNDIEAAKQEKIKGYLNLNQTIYYLSFKIDE